MNRFESLAAPGVRGLSPYVPGKPTAALERELGIKGSIKLASNENPLGPGPRARGGAGGRHPRTSGHYPDGSGHGLRSRLAHRHGVDIDQVTLGNGSNDVLVLLAEAFLVPGVEAVYSQYAFAVYPSAVQASRRDGAGRAGMASRPRAAARPRSRGARRGRRAADSHDVRRQSEQSDRHLARRSGSSMRCCARCRPR